MTGSKAFPSNGPRLSWLATLKSVLPYGLRVLIIRLPVVNALGGVAFGWGMPLIKWLRGELVWVPSFDLLWNAPAVALFFAIFFFFYGLFLGLPSALIFGAPLVTTLEWLRLRWWFAYLAAGGSVGAGLGLAAAVVVHLPYELAIFTGAFGLSYAAAYRWRMLNSAG